MNKNDVHKEIQNEIKMIRIEKIGSYNGKHMAYIY